jgi:ElaB/YqjD/DUF883 family membrane-anchored ribosome-binding protein
LKEELKHDIRDATIGKVENMAQQTAEMMSDAQRSLMQSIRENPVPVALVGIGLGWMILNAANSKKRMGSGPQYEYSQRRGFQAGGYDEQQRGWRTGGMYGDQQRDDYEQGDGYDYGRTGAYGRSGSYGESGTLDRARDKAGDVVSSVKERTSELADQTRQAASRVGERAEEVADRVAEGTRVQTRRLEQAFHDSPLVIGAAALALGLAAGLAIPSTEKEAELVGETRDHLVDKVRDVAEDTKSKVQQVAERVMTDAQSTAKDAAHEVGLTS